MLLVLVLTFAGTDESIEELRALRTKFEAHVQNLRGWARSGGPIDPIWVRDTQSLQRQLHRAQCRAAMRVFTSARESSERCLGAFLVHRNQRAPFHGGQVGSHAHATEYQRRCQAELMACRSVGTFQRFSEQDIAFVCDFCDGHMVWQDLERMPTVRSTQEAINTLVTPPSLSTNNSNWQATATIHSGEATKQIMFAPVVVANHIAPTHGDWEARLLCPLCEELAKQPQDEDDEEEAYHTHEEFPDVASLQEHIEWQHGTNMLPVTLPTPSTENCRIM